MAKSRKDKEIEMAAKAELEKQDQEATATQDAAQAPAEAQEAPQEAEQAQDGQEAAQEAQEEPEGEEVAEMGDEDKAAQDAAQAPAEAQEAPQATKQGEQYDRKPVRGNVLVIYNGFVNLRRTPSMSEDNIAGQAGRGTVLVATAEVEAEGVKWYETVGEVYIRADEAMVEFMRSK